MDRKSIKNLLFSAQLWDVVDEQILRGRTINAITAIRKATGLRIPEAVDLVEQRRSWLQEGRPGEFVVEIGSDPIEESKPAESTVERSFDEFKTRYYYA